MREPKYWGTWKGRVCRAIAEFGPLTWDEIREITGLSSAQLNFHLNTMVSSGLIARETVRGRYLITDLGRHALQLTSDLADSMKKYETVELDRYCPYCGEGKMMIDVYPTYFQGWCTECSPNGSRWTETGVNQYGQEWKNKDLEEFVDEGWNLCSELMDEAIKDSRCGNCSAKMKFEAEEDAIRGLCYSCGSNNCRTIKYVTTDVMTPLWHKYKKISQKVEGPINHKGQKCWKTTLTTPQGHSITQYRKTHTGEIIDQIERKSKRNRSRKKSKATGE